MNPLSNPGVRHKLSKYLDMFKALKEDKKADVKSWVRNNKSYTKFWNNSAAVYKATRTTLNIPESFSFSKMLKGKWGRNAALIGGSIVAFNLLKGMVSRSTGIDPAIPDNYDKGFDNIRSTLSDYGSPLSLLKAASHTITPYKSNVRKALVTNVKTVMNKNAALQASKNAIKHHQY